MYWVAATLRMRLRDFTRLLRAKMGVLGLDGLIEVPGEPEEPIIDFYFNVETDEGCQPLGIEGIHEMPPHVLEGALEQLCASIAAFHRGTVEMTLETAPLPLDDTEREESATVIGWSYLQHAANGIVRATFGTENHDAFRRWYLDEQIRPYTTFLDLSEDPLATLLSLYPDRVLVDGLDLAGAFPSVVEQAAAPFPRVFAEIDAAGLPWKERSHLLFYVAAYAVMEVDVLESNRQGFLVGNGHRHLRERLDEMGFFSVRAASTARRVERLLRSEYQGDFRFDTIQ